LMSESLEGFNVAATRQKAGSAANARAFGGGSSESGLADALNAPAATSCALVIVAFGKASDARALHEVAAVTT